MAKNHVIRQAATQTSGVQYENVDQAYLEQRKLRKSAGWIMLWAMGVGAVIAGDFVGWNFGLSAGGFLGMALALVLMATMYVCMVYSIAELSTALPHAGGFYSFARSAFGPWGGFIVGVTDTIEYVLAPALIAVGIGGYLHVIIPVIPTYVWWVVAYGLFVAINIKGVELTLKVGLVFTILAVAVLVIFYVSALVTGAFDWELLFNVEPAPGQSTWLPQGWYGVFAALPFAIGLYLAIEQVPLAAEETIDVVRDMPRAMILGIFTLLVLSFFTVVLNAGVGGGAAVVSGLTAPLAEGFIGVFGKGIITTALTLLALAGLIASFHTNMYAYGRVIFALSRAGYYPRWLSITGKETRTPHYALIVGAGIGLLAALVIDQFGSGFVAAALVTMVVFGAVVSYTAIMLSYIKLKLERPNLPRPFKSPLGITGAVVGTVLSLVSIAATFAVPSNRPGVIGLVIFLIIALGYFAFYSSKRLVAQAPEEEIALIQEAENELIHG